jgi:serine protease Do
MRVFLVRAIFLRAILLRAMLGLAVFPPASTAQIGLTEFRSAAAWQVQQGEAQSRFAGSYLGIKLSDVDADRATALKLGDSRGVEVKSVEEGSPADHAGIGPGDVLLSYNGENVLGAQQLIRLVQETPAGRKIKIQFWREGKARSTIITTGAPPTSDPGAPFQGFPFPYPGANSPAGTDIPKAILVWRNMNAGMEFEELDSQLSGYFGVSGGVLVRWVEKDSPAEKSGLKPGDVIVSVRHKVVLTARDVASCLRQAHAPAALIVVRNHKKLDVTLALPGSQ